MPDLAQALGGGGSSGVRARPASKGGLDPPVQSMVAAGLVRRVKPADGGEREKWQM
jgi:hypothetical protein